jgi:hypothetical protein
MGPRAGLDGGKSRPTGIRSRTVQPIVAIPTELPGPHHHYLNVTYSFICQPRAKKLTHVGHCSNRESLAPSQEIKK